MLDAANRVLQRIQSRRPVAPKPKTRTGIITRHLGDDLKATPLTPSQVETLVLNNFMAETNSDTIIRFDGIEAFCGWYAPLMSSFSQAQNDAFACLIQARDAIHVGCSCRLNNRRDVANELFLRFIEKNSQTDLLVKIKEVSGKEKVIFAVNNSDFFSV